MSKKISHKIERYKLPPSGIPGVFVMLDIKKEEKRNDHQRLKDNTTREFEIYCSLGKQYKISNDIPTSVNKNSGESFVLLPSDVNESKIVANGESFTLKKNERNEISLITYKCSASNMNEARRNFQNGITPFLDFLSYTANIPLVIDKIYSKDIANEATAINFFTPYESVCLNQHERALYNEMIPIYALYREAKNSYSHYYRFLCYYKILEGIYRHLRPALMKRAESQQIEITKSKELVPKHKELEMFYKNYIDKPIKNLLDNELQKEYRDRVAHYILDDGYLLNLSNYHADTRYTTIILISELCCRVVIDQQNQYYLQFYSKLEGKNK